MPMFRDELEDLINKHNMESGSDTPDFVLAKFLSDCLSAFDTAVMRRSQWYAMPIPLPSVNAAQHAVPPNAEQ